MKTKVMDGMNQYDTLIEAIESLKQQGFTGNFEMMEGKITDVDTHTSFDPQSLTIQEYHRFEGDSNPDDMSVVYALESDDGHRGLLVDAYGTYSSENLVQLIKKLNMKQGIS